MARFAEIRVSFSRQASDGNYGSETARYEVLLVAEDGEALDHDDAVHALASCRAVVHAQLARSPNFSVRRAIEPPKPSDDDTEDLPY